ncbi:MAG: TonB-dependent receptor [Caulobacter sp.]|nr:TonB-dependent receptor [Caulobacter sp.]
MARCLLLAGASALALISIPSVFGLDVAHAQAPPPREEQAKLDEIVVVARRSEERLQDVPLSVTGVSAEQLESRTITTGTDLQKLVPTLNVGVSIFGGTQQFSLRGVRTGVVSYLNEVPVNGVLADQMLWDLSSIQAVSGPQGTLFGKNSTGGAVLFVANLPDDEFDGYVEGRIGRFNLREGTAVVNLPVNAMLALRIGARVTKRDGIIDNLTGPDLQALDHRSVRVSALFKPNSVLTNYTTFNYAHRDDTPYAQISGSGAGTPSCPAALPACVYGASYANELAAQRARGIRTVSIPLDASQSASPWQLTNVLSGRFGALTAKYIFGYQKNKDRQFTSQLSIPLPVIIGLNQNKTSLQTHEFQLLGGAFGDRLKWVTGLYSSASDVDNFNSYLLFAPLGTPHNNNTTQQTGGATTTDSQAVYAQGTYALTDRFNVTVGARYTEDDVKTAQFGYSPGHICNLPAALPSVNIATCTQKIAAKTDAVTYNLSVDFKASDEVLLYATTRKGYNAGGFNPNINDPDLEVVRPEYITDYEAGLKADWSLGGMPVRTNVSTFYAKYKDIQRTTSLVFDNLIVTGNFNAAKATIYGAQIEVLARPVKPLTLQASYGYLHTKYDSFQNALLGDVTGNSFAQAPKDTVNVSATYRHALPSGELVANVSYAYISKVAFADDNLTTPGNIAPGYGLVDARLDWKKVGGGNVDLGVYVKNATDEEYLLNTTDRTSRFGFDSRVYGDPRTFGFEVRYSF